MRSHRAGHYQPIEETLAMMALAGGGAPDVDAGYAFVFQPGGTAGGNVFTTWPSLVAAVNAVSGPKLVEIDTTFAPAVVPAAGGPWLLEDWTLTGKPFGAMLTFAAGATIDPATALLTISGLRVINSGTIVWTGPVTATPTLLLQQAASLSGTVGAVFIDVPSGASFNIFALSASIIGNSVGTAAVEADAGGSANFTLDGGGQLAGGATTGASATSHVTLSPGGVLTNPQGIAFPAIGGIVYVNSPQSVANTNGVLIGPAAPLAFTSSSSITRASSGKVFCTGMMTVTGAVAGAQVVFTLFRNPGGVVFATQNVHADSTGQAAATLAAIEGLPDNAAHSFGIQASSGGSALSSAAPLTTINCFEMT